MPNLESVVTNRQGYAGVTPRDLDDELLERELVAAIEACDPARIKASRAEVTRRYAGKLGLALVLLHDLGCGLLLGEATCTCGQEDNP